MATLSLQLLLAKNKLRSFWGTGRPALHKAADYSVVLQQNGEADPQSPFYPSLLTTKALVSSADSLWERPSHCSSFFLTSHLISQLSKTLIRVKSENPKQVYILAHCRCVFSCTCVHVMCNMKKTLPGGPHLYVNVCIVSVFSVCTYLIKKKHIFLLIPCWSILWKVSHWADCRSVVEWRSTFLQVDCKYLFLLLFMTTFRMNWIPSACHHNCASPVFYCDCFIVAFSFIFQ